MGKRPVYNCIVLLLAACLVLTGCGGGQPAAPSHDGPPRDNTPKVLTPVASGQVTYGNANVRIDASNTKDGYVVVNYTGAAGKIKLLITTPGGTTYTYLLSAHTDEVFPLTEGSGVYQLKIMKNVTGDSYAQLFAQTIDVRIADEFSPFLHPNQYVNFSADSQIVAMAQELSANTYSDLEVVTNIYHYVIGNIAYDDNLAANVTSDYLPDVDDVVSRKSGICFDYASVMTAMLRSQGIPTKLESGYSGSVRHAWISTYVDETGWIDKIISFDGNSWTLMDPTLAANKNNRAENIKQYIGDGSNYTIKYHY